MHVLGAIRQSRTRDRAVSPAAQREQIQAWADSQGAESVTFTEDLSVSGKVSAFVRDGLGPWLTEPDKVAAWDVLCVTKLDRLCRNTADYLHLRQWAEQNGKRIVLLDQPQLDDRSPAGKAMLTIIAAFAEFERDLARERRKDTIAELADQGRWGGGRLPFGFRTEQREDGYYLVPDEDGTADTVREMAAMAIAGKTYTAIARWLNEQHITTNMAADWKPGTVRHVLRSDRMGDLLSPDDLSDLKHALRSREQHHGEWTSGQNLLLRVGYCGRCHRNGKQSPLYRQLHSASKFPRYICQACGASMRQSAIDEQVEAELLARWGTWQYRERKIIPGDDHSKAIRRLERQLEQVRDVEMIDTSPLEAEIARLKALPHEPDREEVIDSGHTIAEHWHSLATVAERNEWLRANEVKLYAGLLPSQDKRRREPYVLMDSNWTAWGRGWQ